VTRVGVSAVLEFMVTPARVTALRRLRAATDVVVIMVDAANSAARAERRDRGDAFLNRAEVLEALGHRSIDDYIAEPERVAVRAAMETEFDVPQRA
jgi:hypothetical protein